MADYRLSPEAEDDLYRIWFYGVRKFGVRQADIYFKAFFEEFNRIAKNPYHYQSVDYIKEDYRRAVSGVDSIYFRIVGDTIIITAIVGRQDIEGIL